MAHFKYLLLLDAVRLHLPSPSFRISSSRVLKDITAFMKEELEASAAPTKRRRLVKTQDEGYELTVEIVLAALKYLSSKFPSFEEAVEFVENNEEELPDPSTLLENSGEPQEEQTPGESPEETPTKQYREENSLLCQLFFQCSSHYSPPDIKHLGLDSQMEKLYTFLDDSCDRSSSTEAPAVLLIGPEGGGKSACVVGCVNELRKKRKEMNDLKVEMFVGGVDRGSERKRVSEEDCPVVVLLEHIELFAQEQPRVLYSFLNHPNENVVAIVATTRRMDAVSLLEKRISSRFEHLRIVFTLPADAEMLRDICRSTVRLHGQHENISRSDVNRVERLWDDLFSENCSTWMREFFQFCVERGVSLSRLMQWLALFISIVLSPTYNGKDDKLRSCSEIVFGDTSILPAVRSLPTFEMAVWLAVVEATRGQESVSEEAIFDCLLSQASAGVLRTGGRHRDSRILPGEDRVFAVYDRRLVLRVIQRLAHRKLLVPGGRKGKGNVGDGVWSLGIQRELAIDTAVGVEENLPTALRMWIGKMKES